jgi:Rrf2 family transcriptional repressor of oqxAB
MKAKGDFAIAVQVLLSCAQQPGKRICSGDLSKSVGVQASRIRIIVSRLVKAGLLDAREGRSGGIELNRSPSKIDLEEVLSVVDPSPLLKIHEPPRSTKCPVGCSMKVIMGTIQEKVEASARKSLRAFKLDDLLEKCEKKPGGNR